MKLEGASAVENCAPTIRSLRMCLVVECGGSGGTTEECVSLMKDGQFETMAMTITPAEVSAIIEKKYPDLAQESPLPEAIMCTPTPARLRRKRPPHSSHLKRKKLVDRFNQMADRSLAILYPSIYYTDGYQEEDAFLPYVSPLKAERASSFLRVRALATPTKRSKRCSRTLFDHAKRFRAHQTYHNTVGLKRKILRLCGVSKSPYSSGKYKTISSKEK